MFGLVNRFQARCPLSLLPRGFNSLASLQTLLPGIPRGSASCPSIVLFHGLIPLRLFQCNQQQKRLMDPLFVRRGFGCIVPFPWLFDRVDILYIVGLVHNRSLFLLNPNRNLSLTFDHRQCFLVSDQVQEHDTGRLATINTIQDQYF